MCDIFFPDECALSAYLIDYNALYQKGIRGIIFDIDNTLVKHNEPADKRAINLFSYLKKTGFKTCVISNNNKLRVFPFAKDVKSEYISKAGKPLKQGYINAMRKMKTKKETTVVIGDQIFTDILGAKRAGIRSILVRQIAKDTDFFVFLKRYPEKLILFLYKKRYKTAGNIFCL